MSARYEALSSLSMFKKTSYDSSTGPIIIKQYSIKANAKKGTIAYISVKKVNGKQIYKVTCKPAPIN